jgi:hypothetical protein
MCYNLDYITELFVFVDEFFKSLENTELSVIMNQWNPNRKGRKKQLSISEVITLNIIRFLNHQFDLKSFHKTAFFYLRKDFPGLPNYENFLKATNKSFPFLLLLVQFLLSMNRETKPIIFAGDSTPLPVCHNKRIGRHKVAKKYANRGKTTKGWFYGFKLHGIVDMNGNFLNICVTSGNVDDRIPLDNLFLGLQGVGLFDAGYVMNQKIIDDFIRKKIFIFSSARNNMKKVMTKKQHNILKKREIVETAWDVLKDRLGIVTSLARSMLGLIRHYFYAILAYFFKNIVENNTKTKYLCDYS